MTFPFSLWKSSSGSGGAHITVSSNWGSSSGAGSTVTSPSRTLTVPSGNPGQVLLGVTLFGSISVQYSYNFGAFTTFVDSDTIAVVNASTLAFKALSLLSGDSIFISVKDNSTGDQFGTCTLGRI